MALQQLGQAGQRVLRVQIIRPRQGELDQALNRAAQCFGVEHGLIAANHPGALQLVQALGHRRGRKVHPPGQFGAGQAGVVMQGLHNQAVEFIQFHQLSIL